MYYCIKFNICQTMIKLNRLFTGLFLSTHLLVQGQIHEMNISTHKPGAPIQPTMYGLFFEDINYGADGGLYAELVKNRSFEFPQSLMGWQTFGKLEVKNDGPFERNPHYVRLSPSGHPHKWTGLENEGYFGIGVKKGEQYRFSVWARIPNGKEAVKIRIELINPNTDAENQSIANQELTIDSKEWKKYRLVLTPDKTEAKASLRIFLTSDGTIDLEHISLFPVATWLGHENGLRKDLVQALYDIRPGVLRFPGGCIVEGTDLSTRYNWKNSIGPVENRPLNENRWHYTFTYRFFPDYYQSYGLRFFEFFQLAEKIGTPPLPVLSCGLACQFQNNNASTHIAPDDLAPYIQDALELIEFANNTPSTTWGKIQAEMDHPEYLSGNSDYRQFGSEFRRRSIRLFMAGNETPTSRSGRRTFLQTGKLVFIPR